MRILGIDYGTKRVGIAVSDEAGKFAIPKSVIKNTRELLEDVVQIVQESNVKEIVIGESRNYKGEPNIVMNAAKAFADKLQARTGISVHAEPEFMTSVQAARFQGETELLDASAAALILQSYLDKKVENQTMPETADLN